MGQRGLIEHSGVSCSGVGARMEGSQLFLGVGIGQCWEEGRAEQADWVSKARGWKCSYSVATSWDHFALETSAGSWPAMWHLSAHD